MTRIRTAAALTLALAACALVPAAAAQAVSPTASATCRAITVNVNDLPPESGNYLTVFVRANWDPGPDDPPDAGNLNQSFDIHTGEWNNTYPYSIAASPNDTLSWTPRESMRVPEGRYQDAKQIAVPDEARWTVYVSWLRANDPYQTPDSILAKGLGECWRFPAPNTILIDPPNGTSNNASPSFVFTNTGQKSTFECALDDPLTGQNGWGVDQEPTACSSPKLYNDLPDGHWTFWVRATDEYGHADPTPIGKNFAIDTAAPTATITKHPAKRTRRHRATFAFRANESATFTCKRDRKPRKACSSPKTYRKLKPGRHTFRVWATDSVGNAESEPAKWRWRIRRR